MHIDVRKIKSISSGMPYIRIAIYNIKYSDKDYTDTLYYVSGSFSEMNVLKFAIKRLL